MNKKKLIIIIAAAVVVIAAAVVLALGFAKGWFTSKPAEKEDDYSVSYVYAEDGQTVQQEAYYNKDGSLAYKVEKGYADTEGKVLAEERYLDAENNLQKRISYDADGKKNGRDEYTGTQVSAHYNYTNGEEDGTYSKFTYTDDGQPLSAIDYDAENNVVRKVERTYNDDGNITLYLETDAQGNTLSKTVYNYNKDGQEEKTVFYNSEGITGYVVYTYEDGKRVRMDQYEDEKITKYILFKYDKDGNVTQEEHFPEQEAKTKKAG